MTQFNPKTFVKKLTYILTLGSFLGSIPTHAVNFNISIENETDKDLGFVEGSSQYSSITFKDKAFQEDFMIHAKKKAIFEIYASVSFFKNLRPIKDKDGISLLLVDPGVDIDPETADLPKVGIIFDKDEEPGVPIFFPLAQEVPEGYQVNIVPDARRNIYRIVISKK